MCAQFEIEKSMFIAKLEKLHINFNSSLDHIRFLPYSLAPILYLKEDILTLEHMNFSLIPSWSKEKKPKFATHNARLETINEKPTWKNIFGKKHCLVPMTSFIEPIYTGEYAGNMMRFKLPECLLVPGLYDEWQNKDTGEIIESFAIVTSNPPPYVEEIGHDRSPIFLDQEKIMYWLETNKHDDQFFFNFLNHRKNPKFAKDIDRKLKPGWEKRI